MRYPSGLGGSPLPRRQADPKVWAAQTALVIDQMPIGTSAPCMNPECAGPVDRLPGTQGPPTLYCSKHCSSRASALRASATDQLAIIEEILDQTKGQHGIPRKELEERARMLRWWLLRLRAAADEP